MDLFHHVSKSCMILTLLLHLAKETPSKLEISMSKRQQENWKAPVLSRK